MKTGNKILGKNEEKRDWDETMRSWKIKRRK